MIFRKISRWWKARRQSRTLDQWYEVRFDDRFIYRIVNPPGQEGWQDQFRWVDIERICFEATDFLVSDDLHFFTTERPESYLVPTEAKGGSQLWAEVIDRGLFHEDLAMEAMGSVEGLFCWPLPEKSTPEEGPGGMDG